MSKIDVLKKRIRIVRSIKTELTGAMRRGDLEIERGAKIAGEIAERLAGTDTLAGLDLEFGRLIKDFSSLKNLTLKKEELKKHDLDKEIADLAQKIIEKGDSEKALSLANEVISVYLRNPDINLDDFKRELLRKWHSLTREKNTKMHKTIEDRERKICTSSASAQQNIKKPAPSLSLRLDKKTKSFPPEEGLILQADDVFGAPGSKESHETDEQIADPTPETGNLRLGLAKLSEKASKLGKLLKESSKEVGGEIGKETGGKLKDAAIGILAKGQEMLERRKK